MTTKNGSRLCMFVYYVYFVIFLFAGTRSSGEYCETTRDCPRGTCDTVLQECIDDPNFTKRVAGLMKRCEFDFECGGGSCKAGYCY